MYHKSLDDDLLDCSNSESEDQGTLTPSRASSSCTRVGTPAGQRDSPSSRLCQAGRSLQTIPSDSFAMASHITDLDLSSNLLSSLTCELEPFRRLRQLDVSSNQLTKLGESLSSLFMLRILLCKNNLLESSGLPKSMSAMQSLEVVNLSGNRLKDIPETLLGLPKLKQRDNIVKLYYVLFVDYLQLRKLPRYKQGE